MSDINNKDFGYTCRCPTDMEGRLCNVYKQPKVDTNGPDNAMIIGVVIGVVLLLGKSFVMLSSLVGLGCVENSLHYENRFIYIHVYLMMLKNTLYKRKGIHNVEKILFFHYKIKEQI